MKSEKKKEINNNSCERGLIEDKFIESGENRLIPFFAIAAKYNAEYSLVFLKFSRHLKA